MVWNIGGGTFSGKDGVTPSREQIEEIFKAPTFYHIVDSPYI